MPKAPTIDDISEDFEIRPRDRERVLQILEKLDQNGNARFLDDREIITRALEVFLTWELEPEKFLDELKKVKLTQSQENTLAVVLDPKFRDDSREFYSTEVEHKAQQAARKSTGDYDSMLYNLAAAKDGIKRSEYFSDIHPDADIDELREISYDDWPLLWNFYSRLLPTKITLTALGDLMNGVEALWIELGEFRVKAFDVAEELGQELRKYEQEQKFDRTKRLSTGFPKPLVDPEKETARLVEKRFKDKYAANIRKNTKTGEYHLEGALAALGLITVKKFLGDHYVTMTDLGKEFYLLDNPRFNPNEEEYIAFYPDEVKFITEKLISQLKLEDLLCKKALEIVSSVDNQEDQIKKLDEAFENEIVKFIKSYKGNQIIKERLDKDFGKIVADPDWRAELERLQETLKEIGPNDELNDEIKKLVEIEKRLEACRVATMGRLSELGLIKWKIGPNTSSEYTILESV